VWLYISTASVLIGAEFNAHVFPKPPGPRRAAAQVQEMVPAGRHDNKVAH